MPAPQTLSASPGPLDSIVEIGWFPSELVEEARFASPQPVLELVRRLSFWRLRGAGFGAEANLRSLPPGIPASFAGARAPFGFCAGNWDGEAVIALGTAESSARQIPSALRAFVGGPEPEPLRLDAGVYDSKAAVCLVGLPQVEGATLPGELRSSADLLFDALGHEWFTLLVFAAPEPDARLRLLLQELHARAEAIDRTYLQLERQANVDRGALRAREFLDRAAAHLQQSATQPLWRTSVLVLAHTAATAQRAADLLATASHDASAERAAPLRVFPCGTSSSGHPPHLNLFTSAQLARLCPLPARDRAGFARSWSCDYDVEHPQIPGDISLGEILDRRLPSGRQFGVAPQALSRHTLVVGHTGAGKTTTVQRLLEGLSSRGIPFLVIEPAKREYAALRDRVPGLRLWAIGGAPGSRRDQLHLNPLSFPRGFPLHTHLDLVRSALTASFGLMPPAPYLLEQALYDAYERRGWDIVSGTHPLDSDPLAFPTLSDLLRSVERVVERAGYDGDLTRNLRSALLTRLGSLCRGPKGLCFDSPANLPDSELFGQPAIFNLAELGSDEEKAFVMGLILVRLFEVRSLGESVDGLRHLLVVEEAHRLLRRTMERSADEGNMAHQAVQTFVNLLAEMRSYGQGFLAVEQLPTKLAPEVVKLAGTKLVHRLLPEDDRDLLGSAMGLLPEQRRMLGLLEVGEAVAHSEGMDNAVRIRVPRADPRQRQVAHGKVEVQDPSTGTLLGWWQERAKWASPLGRSEARGAADGALTAGLMEGGIEAALTALRVTLERLGPCPEDKGGIETLTRFALEDSLLRRATLQGWSSVIWLDLRRALSPGLKEVAARLRQLLASGRPPHSWCSSCPSPCSWRYEATLLVEDDRFEIDLEDAFLAPAAAFSGALASAFRDASERVLQSPEPAQSPGLRHCAAGLAAARWNVSRQARDVLLQHAREAQG